MLNNKRVAARSSDLLVLAAVDQGWTPVLESASTEDGDAPPAIIADAAISPNSSRSAALDSTDAGGGSAVVELTSTSEVTGTEALNIPLAQPIAAADGAPASSDDRSSGTVVEPAGDGDATALAPSIPAPQTGENEAPATSSSTTETASSTAAALAGTTETGISSAAQVLAASSPAAIVSFPGTTSDINQTFAPDASLAIGPGHVITVENVRIQWYDRNGRLQSDKSQFEFFNTSLSEVPVLADARVVYDTVNNRFVVVSTGGTKIFVAVSKDSDPNHGWNYGTINAGLTINGQSTYADYPGLATDGRAIYVTARMDSIGPDGTISSADDVFQEAHLWIVNGGVGTGGLYDGGPMQVSDFGSSVVTNGTSNTFGQPAQILTPTGGSFGTYLVSLAPSTPGGMITLIRVDNPTTSPSFQLQTVTGAPSSAFSDQARQLGTSATIQAHSAGNAVWRDGVLYGIGSIGPTSGPDAGFATAHWYKIETTNLNSPVLVDQGDVGGSSLGAGSGVATFQPTISAGNNGSFLVNFSASGPGLYAGAYYAVHMAGDAAGTVRAPVALHLGEAPYELRNEQGVIRWGDYSGIGLDPLDGNTFWIFNQYAALRGNLPGKWATQIAAVPGAPILPQLVDAVYYYATYPDVARAGANPTQHYDAFGWKEGRNPNAFFNTTAYLNAYADVRAAAVNPLTHYDQNGWREGRDPSPVFDTGYYLAHASDVNAAGVDPMLHFLQYGQAEGRAFNPAVGSNLINSSDFDPEYYLMLNTDVARGGLDPYQHYLTNGWREARDPNAFFSTAGYLASQPDVSAAGVNPLLHYDQSGWREGRDPARNFDTQFYLIHNPDVAAAGMDPLEHYLKYGVTEASRTILQAVGPPDRIDITDFDPTFYLLAYSQVAASGVDPYTDFTSVGWQQGRDPNGLFDTDFYLSRNPDVAAAGVNPLSHYTQNGWREGRDPSALFSTGRYLAANPDVAAAGIDPLNHFLVHGLYEGRLP